MAASEAQHLAHGRFHGVGHLVVLQPGGLVGHELAGFDAGVHVGQLELDRLKLADRLVELLALLGVGQRPLEGPFGDAEGLGGDADPPAVEGVHGDVEPLPFLAEQVFDRHAQVVKGKGGGVAAADAHLVLVLEDGDAGRFQIDDEGADPLVLQAAVEGGKQNAGAEIAAVGDEGLAAVDDKLVAFPLVRGGDAAGVAAGVRFGQQEAADHFAGVERRQPFLLLLLGAEGVDRVAGTGRYGPRSARRWSRRPWRPLRPRWRRRACPGRRRRTLRESSCP